MLKNKHILIEGFTLIEMLITMLITTSVTCTMFYFFNEINVHMNLEDNEFEINNYVNLMFDEIAYELRGAQDLSYQTRHGRTNIQISNTNEWKNEPCDNHTSLPCRLTVDLNRGFIKDDSLRPGFKPEQMLVDGGKSKKYTLYNFKIEDVGFNLGDIYSQSAQLARTASRNLHLEVLLFTKSNQSEPYDTLIYNRRVFCPGLLIAESSL